MPMVLTLILKKNLSEYRKSVGKSANILHSKIIRDYVAMDLALKRISAFYCVYCLVMLYAGKNTFIITCM